MGYKCKCKPGYIGNGIKCKKALNGCDRFGERCEKMGAECVDMEEKPGFKCICPEGFEGNPPKEPCTEKPEALMPTAPADSEKSCGKVNGRFYYLEQKIKYMFVG